VGGGGGGRCRQPLNSLLDFLETEIVEHLLERWEGRHMCEDGAKMHEVLVQPAHDIQHENAVDDIDVEVRERVGEALHHLTVVIDAEVALNEALKGGIDVEGVGFTVAEEVVLQCQPSVTSYVAELSGDVMKVRGDSAPDP
jgi:hypothetical protein